MRLRVVTGIAAFVAIPACCCAGPAPDSSRIAALHAAAAEWNACRIVTRKTRFDLHELRADAGGILGAAVGNPTPWTALYP